jgi:hypothetical protein
MARVTVKQKLQALQTKYSIGEDEARDLLSELEADYSTSEQKAKLAEDWQTWWTDNGAVVQANAQRALQADQLEQELGRIKQAVVPPNEEREQQERTPNFDPKNFADRMFKGTSDLVKDIQKVSFEHFQAFGEMPDYDAIEKIVTNRGLNAYDAYKVWVEPKAREKFENDTRKKLTEEFEEKLKAETSKLQFPSHSSPKQSNTIVRSFLDRKAENDPSEQELLDDFVKDLRTPVSKAGTA